MYTVKELFYLFGNESQGEIFGHETQGEKKNFRPILWKYEDQMDRLHSPADWLHPPATAVEVLPSELALKLLFLRT